MNRTLEELTNSISKGIIQGIPVTWSQAVLEVELHALAIKLSGGYLQEGTGEASSFRFLREHKKVLIHDLIELHLITNKDEQNRWNTMNYNLHRNGEYKINYAWDQALADEIEKIREI